MARETIDVFLDANGNVVTNAREAVEMRRTELEDGKVIKRSVWFATPKSPSQEDAPDPSSGRESR